MLEGVLETGATHQPLDTLNGASKYMTQSEPRAEQDIFKDLAQLSTTPGFVHALSWMSLRDNYVIFDGAIDGETLATSYAPGRTVRTEFSTLLGLMVRQPIDLSEPSPSEIQALLDRTKTLLEELHARLARPMQDSLIEAARAVQVAESKRPPSPFTRADVLREPIFYGGESAYSFQYRDMARERYAADETWLLENKGFTIADAQAMADAISKLQNIKIMDALSCLKTGASHSSSLLSGFTTTAEEIAAHCTRPKEMVQAMLSTFSVTAPSNQDFTSLGAFNVVNACPIVALPDGHYIALQTYGIVESLYDSPFYWMIGDKSYRAKASAHRGDFTEQFVAKRLRSVFGESNVHCNVNIEGSDGRVSEMDVLVLFGDRALIVQCKSKKMTLESRKGNDQALRDDFQKAVQDAYGQGLRCAQSLRQPSLDFVKEDGSKLNIPQLRDIYILCAVSDHYPVLTVQARHFLEYEEDTVIHAPLVADVFLIDVLTEMLASPLRLLSYIDRRVGYAERIFGTNELSILGYHLSQNLWLKDKTSMATVADDFSLDLDTAMTVRREGIPGIATPKGILTKFTDTRVARIIEKIEHEADPDLIDLGFLLLDISGDTVKQLDQGMKDVARRTRLDGRPHDFTLGFDTGDTGLTIHCSRATASNAVEALAGHCQRRKYVHRADNWFGLLVRETDGLPKLSLTTRFPWKRDSLMETLTQGMALNGNSGSAQPTSSNRRPDDSKIGRNDPCFCGSGQKFKKCCLM
ncbi:SEC-C metal-binding domain-containing protein [Pseudomonas syringae group sp. J309-1]|uniref:SEC-C metal-binding domain-containing protein n=1 Tax=Pseudomonas syringae group sp. J309-1 TaxID=3079588 RepID=UPI00290EC80F|nr:SEC-C metal-binding domain-containing protein [Pseudomonas syringae group sp. J309-1]MDU8359500.1 SEC-C metal-binding domain-containing protein [Pseudomonas syringae group sp. J309-1]